MHVILRRNANGRDKVYTITTGRTRWEAHYGYRGRTLQYVKWKGSVEDVMDAKLKAGYAVDTKDKGFALDSLYPATATFRVHARAMAALSAIPASACEEPLTTNNGKLWVLHSDGRVMIRTVVGFGIPMTTLLETGRRIVATVTSPEADFGRALWRCGLADMLTYPDKGLEEAWAYPEMRSEEVMVGTAPYRIDFDLARFIETPDQPSMDGFKRLLSTPWSSALHIGESLTGVGASALLF